MLQNFRWLGWTLTCQTPVWTWKTFFEKLQPKQFSYFQEQDHGKIPALSMLKPCGNPLFFRTLMPMCFGKDMWILALRCGLSQKHNLYNSCTNLHQRNIATIRKPHVTREPWTLVRPQSFPEGTSTTPIFQVWAKEIWHCVAVLSNYKLFPVIWGYSRRKRTELPMLSISLVEIMEIGFRVGSGRGTGRRWGQRRKLNWGTDWKPKGSLTFVWGDEEHGEART